MLTWWTRCVLLGLLLAGCGKSESTQPAGSPSPTRKALPPGLAPMGSNAPLDKPIEVSTAEAVAELDRAIAPYSARGRASYPDAKRRFLAGLPPGDALAVMTKLHSPRVSENVFIGVTSIHGDQISGLITTDIRGVVGYKHGDRYTLSERDVIDWVILHPDGVEEGNLVGKFLDEWRPARR